MSHPPKGVSVIVSSGGQGRLHLLDPMLRQLRRCDGVGQVILSEIGAEPHAVALARRWDADYLFTFAPGQFDRARALNMGARLAWCEDILWADGDLLFGKDFLPRAQEELRANSLDYLWPFTSIAYLDEEQSRDVIAGRQCLTACRPIFMRRPLSDNAGAMGMVTRSFLRRHGGMIEGFRGWGAEDNAWAHKAALLGKARITQRPDQPVWHLYHADSGSHSVTANRLAHRRNPSFEHNMTLLSQVCAISSAEEMARAFPPAAQTQPAWQPTARILFAVPAKAQQSSGARRARTWWAARLEALYGISIPTIRAGLEELAMTIVRERPDIVVGFADARTGCGALSAMLGHRAILVADDTDAPGEPPLPAHAKDHLLLARTGEQARCWSAKDPRVWHRGWDDQPIGQDIPPVLVQLLSHALGQPRTWTLRIAIDRQTLPKAAIDRPAFWYLAFHDTEGTEIARADATASELSRVLNRSGEAIVLERTVRATKPPVQWTVWPVDRQRYWLNKITGTVTADMAAPQG